MPVVQLRPHPDVVWRRLDDEVVLVHLKTNRIYSLNRTAARFWELVSDGADREATERQLLEEFEVAEDDLRAEMADLVDELAKEGLLS
jgi:hypothetical protein